MLGGLASAIGQTQMAKKKGPKFGPLRYVYGMSWTMDNRQDYSPFRPADLNCIVGLVYWWGIDRQLLLRKRFSYLGKQFGFKIVAIAR